MDEHNPAMTTENSQAGKRQRAGIRRRDFVKGIGLGAGVFGLASMGLPVTWAKGQAAAA